MKKIFLLTLFVVLLIPCLSFADPLPQITGVTFEDDILSWDDFDGADNYRLTFPNGAYYTTPGTALNLTECAITLGIESGTYNLVLTAYNEENSISEPYIYEFVYVTDKEKLATPTNLYWDGYIAKWDSVTNADYYYCHIYYDNATQIRNIIAENNYYDFSNDERLKIPDQPYQFYVTALSNDDNYLRSDNSVLSDAMINGSTELEPLATPINLRWDGLIAKWDPVANADLYYVTLYEPNMEQVHELVYDESKDFSGDTRLQNGIAYQFYVQAFSSIYPKSSVSDLSPKMTMGGFEYTKLENLHLNEDNDMVWDSYAGAVKYHYTIEKADGDVEGYTQNGATSLPLLYYIINSASPLLKLSIYAEDADGNRISTITKANVQIREKGDADLDGDVTIIDVRLILQAYINSNSETQWDDYKLHSYDVDNDGLINITDVRIALQKYINSGT